MHRIDGKEQKGDVLGFVARFGSGAGNRGGFLEKLPEASLMTDGASASQPQDGSIPGQG